MSKMHDWPLAKWLKNICYAVEDPAETCQQNITMVHCKYSPYEVTAEIHEYATRVAHWQFVLTDV